MEKIITLPDVLEMLIETKYRITVHWIDRDNDWYEAIDIDYTAAVSETTHNNFNKRKNLVNHDHKVLYIGYNKAIELVEINVEANANKEVAA